MSLALKRQRDTSVSCSTRFNDSGVSVDAGFCEDTWLGTSRPTGEVVDQIMVDMMACRSGEQVEKKAKHLGRYLDTERMNTPLEEFSRFMNNLIKRVFEMVIASDAHARLCGVILIDVLIDVHSEENENKMIRFSNYLQMVIRHPFPTNNPDLSILHHAAIAIGHLTRKGGPLSAEMVDFEMQECLEWLQERGSTLEKNHKRYVATLVLKQLAINAPTLFNPHVGSFLKAIWFAIRDSKLLIREAAIDALSAVLALMSSRGIRWRTQWYFRLFDKATQIILGASTAKRNKMQGSDAHFSTEFAIHGALLTYGRLFEHASDFMLARFKEVCDTVLSFREHRSPLIRDTLIAMLSQLASYCPDAFIRGYLDESVSFILLELQKYVDVQSATLSRYRSLNHVSTRELAFQAFGYIAAAAKEHIVPFLPSIMLLIELALENGHVNASLCHEALFCLTMLIHAVKTEMLPYLNSIPEFIFRLKLSEPLVHTMLELCNHIPQIRSDIQRKLLHAVSSILAPSFPEIAGSSFGRSMGRIEYMNMCASVNHVSALQTHVPGVAQHMELNTQDHSFEQIKLALKTLGTFDLSGQYLHILIFLRSVVVPYLEHESKEVRIEAVQVCCRLAVPMNVSRANRPLFKKTMLRRIITDLVEKVLMVGIADPEPCIRSHVFRSFDARYDPFLSKQECQRCILMALNDEFIAVRELALVILSRTVDRNPAHVVPELRKMLVRLLIELEFSNSRQRREESSSLLGSLISNVKSLVRPYTAPIIKVFLPQLQSQGVSSHMLQTLGQLASADHSHCLLQYSDELFPILVRVLQNNSQGMNGRHVAALRTLGQIIQSTGNVTLPLQTYPSLLRSLLTALLSNAEQDYAISLHLEAIKTLGILGAYDPFHVTTILPVTSTHNNPREETEALSDSTASNSEEIYATAATEALMRILRSPTLIQHHSMVIQAVMFIFKSLGVRCVPFLPQIVPPFLLAMKSCDDSLLESLFQQLAALVSVVQQHIRIYLPGIIDLIHLHWPEREEKFSRIPTILILLEELSKALLDEFKQYLIDIVPLLLDVLFQCSARSQAYSLQILHTFQTFGPNIADMSYLIVPPLLQIAGQIDADPAVKLSSIETVRTMCFHFDLAPYASSIIHPLLRSLRSPGSTRELVDASLETLCVLAQQLESQFYPFAQSTENSIRIARQNNPKISSIGLSRIVNAVKSGSELDENLRWSPPAMKNTLRTMQNLLSNPDSGQTQVNKLLVSQQNLKKSWEVAQRSTKEDWNDWIRRFSLGLLKESMSPALRSCSTLAQKYHPLAKELFNVAFMSCWNELHDQYQDDLIRCLETVFLSPTVSNEILQRLLDLCEFMEHEGCPLPIQYSSLADLAEKCHAYAKALRFRELEFRSSNELSSPMVEALIRINNELDQPEAASGILEYTKATLGSVTETLQLKESWFERLQRWDDALEAYERGQISNPTSVEHMLGRMRCLSSLNEWDRLYHLSYQAWHQFEEEPLMRQRIAPLAATAACNLGLWSTMSAYVDEMNPDSTLHEFFSGMLAVHRHDYEQGKEHIRRARIVINRELPTVLNEGYSRAYKLVVQCQQLSELEEIISLKHEKQMTAFDLKALWKDRLYGCQQHVQVLQEILAVRSLVLSPFDDMHTWVRFAVLARKSGRLNLSYRVLSKLLHKESQRVDVGTLPCDNEMLVVSYSYLKHLWAAGKQEEACCGLQRAISLLDPPEDEDTQKLHCLCYLKLSEWKQALTMNLDDFDQTNEVLEYLSRATESDSTSYRAWHTWSLLNYSIVTNLESKRESSESPLGPLTEYVTSALHGFFISVGLKGDLLLQDTLRLLNLWFRYGHDTEVQEELAHGFDSVSIDTWLGVVPQIIARIDTPQMAVRQQIQSLLHRIGASHPQALIYPITVASKSLVVARKDAAMQILNGMRGHAAVLVEQALMVSQELIRVSILWNEMWHEALEEASRMYFVAKDIHGMINTLEPLHIMMAKGAETLREVSFQQALGQELEEAYTLCKKYRVSGKQNDINQAWEIYCHVFRKITQDQLPQMTDLELQYVSPRLLAARDLELCVPGTYSADLPVIGITRFEANLRVIESKQRPRNLSILGSDGVEHGFLLKGHEDLRLDERVMQLFGLVNVLIEDDRETAKRDLGITRYSVIPLAPNSGLIEWLGNCDTLHALIKEHRDRNQVVLTIEHQLMQEMSSDYVKLPTVHKVEIFQHALSNTSGMDLNNVLWQKSFNAEQWLHRRTNYTRSLAVMSMVGYILGLGDRHPCNLMLDRSTGKNVHIDFGDCFEVAMQRDKYPETIPFRLTRMLINAMEVSGIEGNYATTCQRVMRVMRESKETLLAVLEAFVHDPLINWRLLNTNASPDQDNAVAASFVDSSHMIHSRGAIMSGALHTPQASLLSRPQSSSVRGPRSRRSSLPLPTALPTDELNARAVSVLARVKSKLSGADFDPEDSLSVQTQVRRLFQQATSHENLCRCYVGWCPFW